MSKESQTGRLIAHFKNNPNREIPSVELHRIASGKEQGWCASMSRRITECRNAGLHIPAPRKSVQPDGTIFTYYTNIVTE